MIGILAVIHYVLIW